MDKFLPAKVRKALYPIVVGIIGLLTVLNLIGAETGEIIRSIAEFLLVGGALGIATANVPEGAPKE